MLHVGYWVYSVISIGNLGNFGNASCKKKNCSRAHKEWGDNDKKPN